MDNQLKILTITSILIFLVMIPIALLNGIYGFIPDLIIFIILTIFFAWTYNTFRMTPAIFTLLTIGHLLHACGIFGWYHISPVPIQWDHITHFLGELPYALLFFNFFSQWADTKWLTKKNLLLLIAIFLAAFGVGAVVEMSEFLGYLKLGFGDGALMFGPGDSVAGFEGSDLIDAIGGGWINTGWDLIFNTTGILFGIAMMIIQRIIARKPEKAYYYETIESYSNSKLH